MTYTEKTLKWSLICLSLMTICLGAFLWLQISESTQRVQELENCISDMKEEYAFQSQLNYHKHCISLNALSTFFTDNAKEKERFMNKANESLQALFDLQSEKGLAKAYLED